MRTCILAALLASLASPAPADSPDDAKGLTLEQAHQRVLEHNPGLGSARYAKLAATARARQSSQGTPWQLGIDLENLGGNGSIDGLDRLESTVTLGRVIESGDRARLRGEVADAENSVLHYEQAAARLELLYLTTRHFLGLAHVQAMHDIHVERVDIKRRRLRSIERLRTLGKATTADVNRSRIALHRAELALEDCEHRTRIANARLAALWSEPAQSIYIADTDLYQLDPVPPMAEIESLLENNPGIIGLVSAQRLHEARLRLAGSQGGTDIELHGGLRHYRQNDDLGVVVSLRFPLGSDERSEPLRDEARAQRDQQQLQAQALRLELRTTLYELRVELEHERHLIDSLRSRIIPDAGSVLDDINAGYLAGKYTLLELTQAEDSLLDAQLEALQAAFDYQVNSAEISRLTGTTFSVTDITGQRP